MPCFNAQLTNQRQFLIAVFIVDDRSITQNTKEEVNFDNQKTYTALIDTGATGTCITEEVAKGLNLIPTCKKQINTLTTC